ncbi:MAG TPA: GAF domain-containing protein [Ramlibacter sp.]|nr:GAF domain-containing protein [Ramlibacter sp.]
MGRPPAFCSLDEIIVPPQFYPAGAVMPPRRRTDETEAFVRLSRTLAQEPGSAAQQLVDTAMALTGAGSAGLSVAGEDHGKAIFRWIATSGEFARYVNGTMPRDFSPCGTVLDRGEALLMRDPVRYYAYISQLHAPVRNALLVPFGRQGKWVGTVWVVSHLAEKSFSRDDLRIVQGLATFASAVLDAVRFPVPA